MESSWLTATMTTSNATTLLDLFSQFSTNHQLCFAPRYSNTKCTRRTTSDLHPHFTAMTFAALEGNITKVQAELDHLRCGIHCKADGLDVNWVLQALGLPKVMCNGPKRKRYLCPKRCGKGFSRRDGLTRHLKKSCPVVNGHARVQGRTGGAGAGVRVGGAVEAKGAHVDMCDGHEGDDFDMGIAVTAGAGATVLALPNGNFDLQLGQAPSVELATPYAATFDHSDTLPASASAIPAGSDDVFPLLNASNSQTQTQNNLSVDRPRLTYLELPGMDLLPDDSAVVAPLFTVSSKIGGHDAASDVPDDDCHPSYHVDLDVPHTTSTNCWCGEMYGDVADHVGGIDDMGLKVLENGTLARPGAGADFGGDFSGIYGVGVAFWENVAPPRPARDADFVEWDLWVNDCLASML